MSINDKPVSPTLSALIGGLASVVELTFSYPFEYTKTSMHLYSEQNKLGMYQVARNTVRDHGFFSLYRGYSSLLLFGIPKAQVRFGMFDFLHKYVFVGERTVATQAAAGAISGAAEAILVLTIAENLKIKLIHDRVMGTNKYKNLLHGISTIAKELGPSGLYRGCLPQVLKESSSHAIRFPVFSLVQRRAGKFVKRQVPRDFIAVGTAGLVSVALNNPIDVIKSNLQGLQAHRYKGVIDCGMQLYRKDGFFRAFYRGIAPRYTRVGIEMAVLFAAYNSIKNFVLKHFA